MGKKRGVTTVADNVDSGIKTAIPYWKAMVDVGSGFGLDVLAKPKRIVNNIRHIMGVKRKTSNLIGDVKNVYNGAGVKRNPKEIIDDIGHIVSAKRKVGDLIGDVSSGLGVKRNSNLDIWGREKKKKKTGGPVLTTMLQKSIKH